MRHSDLQGTLGSGRFSNVDTKCILVLALQVASLISRSSIPMHLAATCSALSGTASPTTMPVQPATAMGFGKLFSKTMDGCCIVSGVSIGCIGHKSNLTDLYRSLKTQKYNLQWNKRQRHNTQNPGWRSLSSNATAR